MQFTSQAGLSKKHDSKRRRRHSVTPLLLIFRRSLSLSAHPSATAAVSRSRREEKPSDCMNMSQTFKKKSFIEVSRQGEQFISVPSNSLTVSAIRSSFFITGVPDWHKIDFSVASKKKKNYTQNRAGTHMSTHHRMLQILL